MGSIELPNPHWKALTPETQQAYRIIADLEFIHDFYLLGGLAWLCTWAIVSQLT